MTLRHWPAPLAKVRIPPRNNPATLARVAELDEGRLASRGTPVSAEIRLTSPPPFKKPTIEQNAAAAGEAGSAARVRPLVPESTPRRFCHGYSRME